ncbi:ABC transporter ATP-binding protein [Moraxella bovoculi]|uniref:ABC transporter ATP-binding protein n=1 Tax=Moraxella bovoculi TaxID=386891 RepID=UPI0009BAAC07|nr:ATP-binding cassette domain-containing protein [Moraxella bovoculi]
MNMPSIPLLIADSLCYQDGQKLLLNQVSFTLMAGQKVVLLGRSGSGKSLLLQALADLLPLQTGEIYLNDPFGGLAHHNSPVSIANLPPRLYRSQVALIHQTPSLTDGTVLDNLMLPFGFKHHQGKVFDKNWHIARLAMLDKGVDFLGQSVHKLSGGERQLVNFLRSLQFDPKIVLFDEITSALDTKTAQMLMQLVLDWHGNDKAMIWVTHTPDEARHLSAEVWHMDGGVLSTDGAVD